jgi:hypothetical protein
MKPMPNANEHRRLGKEETKKAKKLPAGTAKEAHLKNARDHELSAHSEDWRGSNLRAPK